MKVCEGVRVCSPFNQGICDCEVMLVVSFSVPFSGTALK